MVDYVTELFYDGVWNDITSDCRNSDAFTINRGRKDWATLADPATLSLKLNNSTSRIDPTIVGRYSPRNPRSDLYGKIGRNTPIRVRSDSSAPVYDAASSTNGTGNLSWTHTPVGTPRGVLVFVSQVGVGDYVAQVTYGGVAMSPIPLSPGQGTDGAEDGVIYAYFLGHGLPTGAQTVVVTLTSEGITAAASKFAVSTTVTASDNVRVSATNFTTSASSTNPSITVTTDDEVFAAAMLFSGHNGVTGLVPASGYTQLSSEFDHTNNVSSAVRKNAIAGPGTITAGGWTAAAEEAHMFAVALAADVRFTGEVTAWPVKWDLSDTDIWVNLQASGILRRLQRGTKPLKSAPYRYITSAANVVSYWSLEGGNIDTGQLTSVVGASDWRPLSGESQFGVGTLASWLPEAVSMSADEATMLAKVSMTSSPTRVATDFLCRPAAADSGPFTLNLAGNGAGGGTRWVMTIVPSIVPGLATIQIQLLVDGSFAFIDDVDAAGVFDGFAHHIRLEAIQDGADIDWAIYVDGLSVLAGTETATTLSGISEVRMSYNPGTTRVPFIFGHVVVWDGVSTLSDVVDAAFGHTGEMAGDRLERLTTEEVIPFSNIGELSDTTTMGPQSPIAVVELLQEAAKVDLGLLHDDPTSVGLQYRTRVDLYTQTPALTVDYSTGIIDEPFFPVDDDQTLRNNVEVIREGGSGIVAEDTTSPLSTQNPPEGVGKYDISQTLNLESDSQLNDQAYWRLHLGTVDEARFPVLKFNLRNAGVAALVDDILAAKEGDIIQIDNPPMWLPGGPYKLLVEGIREEKTQETHTIQFNCSPGSAWTVGVWEADGVEPDPDEPKRYDTAGTIRTSTTDSTQTSITFTVTSGPFWTTSTDDLPFDIMMGGERMRVTAITAPSGDNQTFTVQRSINGVVKSHPTNTTTSLFTPARYAL